MNPIVKFALNHRIWIVGICVVLSLISIFFIFRIRVDNSIETLSVDNDPKLLLLQQVEKTFGGNEFVVISFKGNDIFSERVLSMIDAMTRDMEKIENVEDVLSLTNAEIAKDDADGLGTGLLVPEGDRTGEDMHALKELVISRQLYEKLLYSASGDATSIIAWIVPLGMTMPPGGGW